MMQISTSLSLNLRFSSLLNLLELVFFNTHTPTPTKIEIHFVDSTITKYNGTYT